ncbi:MAG: hypothetical protein KTR30_31465 [Saprospiraceae bacterium]|nr:hypothetical protein [Saprospiraceae bacterium]
MPNPWQHTDVGPGRTVEIKGQTYLYFSGTSYLGLNQHPAFKALVLEGIEKFGVNFGGSRRSNLRFELYEQVEHLFAEWAGAPASLLFSSGSLAGQVLHRIMSDLGEVLYAPGTHPALWGEKEPPMLDYQEWSEYLLPQLQKREGKTIIFANSVDPLRSRAYDFSWVSEIPEGPLVYLVVDDSHGFGLRGDAGMGIYSSLETPTWVQKVVLASLGKAFSLPAGIILGHQEIIDKCWESPFFGGASPLPPAFLYALVESTDLWRKQLKILRESIRYFDKGIKGIEGFEHLERYPVYYCRENKLAEALWQENIMISSFPYPGPKDPVITRVVLNALHQAADIERLVAVICSETD